MNWYKKLPDEIQAIIFSFLLGNAVAAVLLFWVWLGRQVL